MKAYLYPESGVALLSETRKGMIELGPRVEIEPTLWMQKLWNSLDELEPGERERGVFKGLYPYLVYWRDGVRMVVVPYKGYNVLNPYLAKEFKKIGGVPLLYKAPKFIQRVWRALWQL